MTLVPYPLVPPGIFGTVRNRVLAFLLSLLCLFAFGLLGIVLLEHRRARDLQWYETSSYALLVRRILGVHGSLMETYAYDYTYWDDMVRCVEQADRDWAEQNIRTSLASYKVDAAWVYRPDFSLVYSVNAAGDERLQQLPELSPDMTSRLALERFSHFFAATPLGLMEIRGAPIQPSSDNERTTGARGYFFAGRLWHDEHLAQLTGLIGGQLQLEPSGTSVAVAEDPGDSPEMIRTYEVLRGWDGHPRAVLRGTRVSEQIGKSREMTSKAIVGFGIFAFVSLGLVYIFLNWALSRPLRLITLGLETGHAEPVQPLQEGHAEFSRIAKLIESYFVQERELVREVIERKRAEERVTQLNQALSRCPSCKAAASPPPPNQEGGRS